MRFSSVNLPNVEAGFIGEGEIAAIPRNGGCFDAILGGLGGQLRDAARGRAMLLRQEQTERYPQKNEDDCAGADEDPPAVKARRRLWSGLDGWGLDCYRAVAVS